MKYLRMALSCALVACLCLLPLAWAAEDVDKGGNEAGAQPTQGARQTLGQEPTQQPTQTPAQTATQEPAQQPPQESTQQPTQQPAQEPTQQPAQTPTPEPAQSATEVPAATATPGADADPTGQVTTEPTPDPTPEAGPTPDSTQAYLNRLAASRSYSEYLAALREQLTAYQQSALLPELVSRLESGRYAQFENGVQSSLEAEIERQIQQGSASDATVLAYYKAKRETDILSFIAELTEGSIRLGNVSWGSNALKRGQSVVVAVPVVFTPANGKNAIASNVSGNTYVRYANSFSVYDDALCGYLSYVRVDIDSSDDQFPFEAPDSSSYTLLGQVGDNYRDWGLEYDAERDSYSGLAGDQVVNGGFALFPLKVKNDLYTGSYPVNFTVYWTNAQTGKTTTTEGSVTLNIQGKTESSGGGYYGGGGGGAASPTLSPSTKLYVESLTTEPSEVSAGDTFDLVIAIRNTSPDKYVQNMKVTVTAAEDALLPVSGSSTVYISRIDADSEYELRMPVKAKLDMPDEPLKIDVTLDYEDSEVTALSASQTLVMQVAQVRRLNVSEPSLPTDTPEAGDTYPITVQLVNEGRTTLYNVTVTASSDNPQLLQPLPYYVGNMDGGTSHKAEINLVPLMEGMYDIYFDITYENAMGEQFSMDPQFASFYAAEAETYDYNDYTYEDYTEPVEEKPAAMEILKKMPWWLYAAAGALMVSVITLGGASAHAKRRKALEEDEME